ncbi:MAG: phosphatidate cytidylyltransferase [Hyphomicrobiaceae bacterium]|nr:phosphatidate cytidylyltransferase [Hyphomicrobiaceae bacterium]
MPRVLSGIVMGTIAFAAVWFGSWPFLILLTFVGSVIAWEWSNIVRAATDDAPFYAHGITVIGAIVLAALGYTVPAILLTLTGTVLVAVLSLDKHPLLSGTGVAYAALPCIALLWLRADAVFGFAAVVYIVGTVVATDTGAYFAGRLLGGPKLWPRVSPKKTWSGLLGGMTAAAIVGLITAALVSGANAWHLAVLSAVLAIVAQAGDLAESALKRAFDTKDASALIPGHGGVMDRVDGLVTAAIAAAFYAASLDVFQPARALLTW